jgi:hypothetical protein
VKLPRHKALALLSQCDGDEIWSLDHCRKTGVPEPWIGELSDAYESGFQNDRQTTYVENRQTNQYHGVRDVDLATKLCQSLGLDAQAVTQMATSRRAVVLAIKEAVEEG